MVLPCGCFLGSRARAAGVVEKARRGVAAAARARLVVVAVARPPGERGLLLVWRVDGRTRGREPRRPRRLKDGDMVIVGRFFFFVVCSVESLGSRRGGPRRAPRLGGRGLENKSRASSDARQMSLSLGAFPELLLLLRWRIAISSSSSLPMRSAWCRLLKRAVEQAPSWRLGGRGSLNGRGPVPRRLDWLGLMLGAPWVVVNGCAVVEVVEAFGLLLFESRFRCLLFELIGSRLRFSFGRARRPSRDVQITDPYAVYDSLVEPRPWFFTFGSPTTSSKTSSRPF